MRNALREGKEKVMHTPLTNKYISSKVKNFLKKNSLEKEYRSNPETLLLKLNKDVVKTNDPKQLLSLAELSYFQGKKEGGVPGLTYFLSAAVYASRLLKLRDQKVKKLSFTQENTFLCSIFNHLLAEIIKIMQLKKYSFSETHEFKIIQGKITLPPADSKLPFPIEKYQKFLLCNNLPTNKDLTPYKTHGIGVPLIAIIKETKKIQGKKLGNLISEIYSAPYPATAFMRFSEQKAGYYQAQLKFYDPHKQHTLLLKGQKAPLSIDITTQLSYLIKNGPGYSGFNALANPKNMHLSEGLYLLTPYDENKIPVVIVHGLMSRPYTWVKMLNHLFNNEKLQKKFQFCLFAYPTGYPILLSAAKLRDALNEAQELFDPNKKNQQFNKMMVMGHSMGGLLTKMLTQDSGNQIQELVFQKSIDELEVSKKQKDLLKNAMIFKPLPYIKRVIFMSTPHHGAEMTHWISMRLAVKFINLPADLVKDIREVKKQVKLDTGVNLDSLNGVDGLNPQNKVTEFLNTFPIQAKFHSIMGNQKIAGKINGSDGIVKYKSSHLEGAESELILKSGHDVQSDNKCILEVEKILLLHLK